MSKCLTTILIISTVASIAGFSIIAQAQPPRTQKQRQTDDFIIKPPDREGYKTVSSGRRNQVTNLTGSLSIAAESDAIIYLERVGNQKFKLQGQVSPGEVQFIFNGLAPGRYRVSAELPGYKNADGDDKPREVEIKANLAQKVDFKLIPITYNLTVETNVKTGEVRYSAAGQSNQMVEEIKNGRALLSNLIPGKYELEISTTELGYQLHKETVEVGEGKTRFRAELKRRLSEETYTANWATLDEWKTPPGWAVSNYLLMAKGKGVGLPRNELLRHYADFQLVCNVKMVNDVAASFVLRAQEKKDGKLSYYLIQITGSKSDQPHVLRGFVITDGVEKKLPTSITYSPEQLPAGQFFRVIIECVGNSIAVKVLGDEIPLGELKDFDRQFLIGAPGIAVRDNEEMEVEMFYVTPKK
jgi:hypothetical protein